MGINLNNFIRSEEEMENFLTSFSEHVEERERYKIDLLINRGYVVLESVLKVVRNLGHLSGDDLEYAEEGDYEIDVDDFHILFDVMIENSNEVITDEENDFPHGHYFYEYKGEIFKLFIMYGQGTYVAFSSPDEELLGKINKINRFEDLVERFKL
jgi:hypothetical protein